jgi:biotin carboxylase
MYGDKKLLVIGGNAETAPLVTYARSRGAFVIVVDPYPNAGAKQVADKSFDLDPNDISALVNLARREAVNGVVLGVADKYVHSYYKICKELNLPCFATESSATVLANKSEFKKACAKYNVVDIPSVEITASSASKLELVKHFPVFFKPVDSAAGVGTSVCGTAAELELVFEKSINHSIGKSYLIEPFLDCDSLIAYYTILDGIPYLSATADRYHAPRSLTPSPVAIAHSYPSKHTEQFVEQANPPIVNMITKLAAKNAVLLIQFFFDGKSFFAYDPGFRLQGEAPHYYINHLNGFDHRELLINQALGIAVDKKLILENNDYLFGGKKCVTIWILLRAGKIHSIDGLEMVKADPAVIFTLQRFTEGNTVTNDMLGTERQVFARFYLIEESKEKLNEAVYRILKNLNVLDENGEDMILNTKFQGILGMK